MAEIKAKRLGEFYLSTTKALQDAFIKLGMRSMRGCPETPEVRKALWEIQEVFFPEWLYPDGIQRTILVEAAHILTDAWAGMPVENLPSVSRLQIAAHNAKQLRDLPLSSEKGGG